jgi:hypothetical protein
MTWVVIVVPLILTLTLVGAGAFAVTQALRPGPQPSTATPQWQPSVDYAKQFAVFLTSLSPQTADSDIQAILDGSTGTFHDDFARDSSGFKQTIMNSNVTTQGTVKQRRPRVDRRRRRPRPRRRHFESHQLRRRRARSAKVATARASRDNRWRPQGV